MAGIGPLIKSALKSGIDNLPGKGVTAQSLPNLLKKQGVKEEELKFSGLKLPTKGKVPKEELLELEAGRVDKFGVVEGDGGYRGVGLPAGRMSDTYKERVYTFSNRAKPEPTQLLRADIETAYNNMDNPVQAEAVLSRHFKPEDIKEITYMFDELKAAGQTPDEVITDTYNHFSSDQYSRYISDHFQEIPDYLMHTRSYDAPINGRETRVVQEIQSDLHQDARKAGGYDKAIPQEDIDQLENFIFADDPSPEIGEEIAELLNSHGIEVDDLWLDAEQLLKRPHGIPESPYKNSWLSKGIERELAQAIEDGSSQLAIPIKGSVQELHRDIGVQKWYETQVKKTAEKIAKANGMDFRMETERLASDWDDEQVVEFTGVLLEKMKDKKHFGVASWLQDVFDFPRSEAIRLAGAMETGDKETVTSLTKLLMQPQVEYAIITPKAGMRPGFSLYSIETGGALLAYEAIRDGKPAEELLAERGYDKVEARKLAKQAKKALDAGYTRQELQEYLTEQEPEMK